MLCKVDTMDVFLAIAEYNPNTSQLGDWYAGKIGHFIYTIRLKVDKTLSIISVNFRFKEATSASRDKILSPF